MKKSGLKTLIGIFIALLFGTIAAFNGFKFEGGWGSAAEFIVLAISFFGLIYGAINYFSSSFNNFFCRFAFIFYKENTTPLSKLTGEELTERKEIFLKDVGIANDIFK